MSLNGPQPKGTSAEISVGKTPPGKEISENQRPIPVKEKIKLSPELNIDKVKPSNIEEVSKPSPISQEAKTFDKDIKTPSEIKPGDNKDIIAPLSETAVEKALNQGAKVPEDQLGNLENLFKNG